MDQSKRIDDKINRTIKRLLKTKNYKQALAHSLHAPPASEVIDVSPEKTVTPH